MGVRPFHHLPALKLRRSLQTSRVGEPSCLDGSPVEDSEEFGGKSRINQQKDSLFRLPDDLLDGDPGGELAHLLP